MTRTDTLRIRRTIYRGRSGFLLCGTSPDSQRIRIFTLTKNTAEAIKQVIKEVDAPRRWAMIDTALRMEHKP